MGHLIPLVCPCANLVIYFTNSRNADLPYEPPFDFELPDYKQVGRMLFQIGHSFQYDDAPAPADLEIAATELEEANWNMISLPELGMAILIFDYFQLIFLAFSRIRRPIPPRAR
jgi:hypothetical protein